MMHFLLDKEIKLYQDPAASEREEKENVVWRIHSRFDKWFERRREGYRKVLVWTLENKAITLACFGLFILLSLPLAFIIGQDFFPYVDSGQMDLHIYPPQGLRPEDSEQYFAAVEKEIRRVIPPEEIKLILDNIGLPNGGINLAFTSGGATSDSDGDIQIALNPGKRNTQKYMRELRAGSAQQISGWRLFLPAGQHYQPDPRLRPARAHRPADFRARQAELSIGTAAFEGTSGHTRRRGRAYQSAD